MNVDVFDPSDGPPRAFVIEAAEQKVVGLFDGSSDWGFGAEAAEWTRRVLSDRWTLAAPRSTGEVADHLREALSRIPSSLRDQEFGMSFSGVVLLCGPEAVSAVCSGMYALRSVRQEVVRTLFRPRLLGDDLLAKAQMTPDEVEAFLHRNICVGPFLGVSDELVIVEDEMQPGDRVVVSYYLSEPKAFDAVLPGIESARQVVTSRAEGAHPFPAVVVTWP